MFVDILGCVDHNNDNDDDDDDKGRHRNQQHDYDSSQCDTESEDGSADKSVRLLFVITMSDVSCVVCVSFD